MAPVRYKVQALTAAQQQNYPVTPGFAAWIVRQLAQATVFSVIHHALQPSASHKLVPFLPSRVLPTKFCKIGHAEHAHSLSTVSPPLLNITPVSGFEAGIDPTCCPAGHRSDAPSVLLLPDSD